MRTVRDILESIEEAKRQPKDEASKSYVLLAAVQAGLEKALRGWKLNIEGVRGGERKGGADESDDFTLYAYGPNREHVLVHSSNDAKEHVASAQVTAEKTLRKAWEQVGKGDAKQIVAWLLDALPKAGVAVQEGRRTVADLLGEMGKTPRAKFSVGDKVRIHDEWDGVVTQVKGYDDHLGQYRYKVARDDGARDQTWNEDSLTARK
jgi:hypothetical protein